MTPIDDDGTASAESSPEDQGPWCSWLLEFGLRLLKTSFDRAYARQKQSRKVLVEADELSSAP